MTVKEKIIKYCAIAFAAIIIVGIISGIAVGIGAIAGVGGVVGETRSYEGEGVIRSIEIEVGAGDIRIVEGEKFSVESNLKKLTFRQSGDRVIIKEDSFGNNRDYNEAFLTVTIPHGIELKEIAISTGACNFTADVLSAEVIDLELGAGNVKIDSLVATREIDIEGGAGNITIGDGMLHNLQLEMGVGELSLTAKIVGGELNFGVGKARVTLVGSLNDYTVELNKSIGEIRFDGDVLSSGGVIGRGDSRVEIEGGIGSITVDFK